MDRYLSIAYEIYYPLTRGDCLEIGFSLVANTFELFLGKTQVHQYQYGLWDKFQIDKKYNLIFNKQVLINIGVENAYMIKKLDVSNCELLIDHFPMSDEKQNELNEQIFEIKLMYI